MARPSPVMSSNPLWIGMEWSIGELPLFGHKPIQRQRVSWNLSPRQSAPLMHANGRNWKEDLHTFLMNYRATPHTTTGFAPSNLLFNRLIKTKLPQVVSEPVSENEFYSSDERSAGKVKMKEITDRTGRANRRYGVTPTEKVLDEIWSSTVLCCSHERNYDHSDSEWELCYSKCFSVQKVTVGEPGAAHMDQEGCGDGHDDDPVPVAGPVNPVIANGRNQPRYPGRDRHPVQHFGHNIYEQWN